MSRRAGERDAGTTEGPVSCSLSASEFCGRGKVHEPAHVRAGDQRRGEGFNRPLEDLSQCGGLAPSRNGKDNVTGAQEQRERQRDAIEAVGATCSRDEARPFAYGGCSRKE